MSDPKPEIQEPDRPSTDTDLTLPSWFNEADAEATLGGDRDPLDRLAEEFATRSRRGEHPTISEYEARFPDQAKKVRGLLEAVAMMEQLRRGGERQARFLPDRIGEFRVLRELGRGGMGVVYEAVQESLWRHVAVKAIHQTQVDPKRVERFRREAQAVAQLHHTNIVPIFGVGEHDGIPYYAMQYIRGSGLDVFVKTWREQGSPKPAERWRLAARFALQAAGALAYAHEQGVLHRDIKPSNLLVDEHESVWVTDFGLAKMLGFEDLTASGDVIGTLRYLAPESLRGVSDGRSDVYSLGLTLYEMLTLEAPFGDLTPSELLQKVSEGQPTKPRQVDPSIPLDLETIVLKATARDLNDRYGSARDLAVDLGRFIDDRPILARRANWVERSVRWSRRNRTVAALSAIATGCLILATIVGWVGYVNTNAALGDASANLKLAEENISLAEENISFLNGLFEDVFDKLTAIDKLEADAEVAISPPPISDHKGGPGGHRDFARGGPGSPIDEGVLMSELMSGKHGRIDLIRRESRAKAQALLESVLTSYDRFARKNKANSRLQGEAAWIYHKMGLLDERLGRVDQADLAFDRTLTIYEELSGQGGVSLVDFGKFPKVCSAVNPWEDDPGRLAAIDRRLTRMDLILGRLLAVAPDDPTFLRARMQLLAKLGLVRYHKDHQNPGAFFDQALLIAETLIRQAPEDGLPHSDRSDVLEAYAMVLEDRKETARASGLLEAAFEDLEWVASDGLRSLAIAARMESLSDDFERLGDQKRADEVQVRADQIDPRPPRPNRKKPGPPFGPQRPDAAQTPDEPLPI